MDKNTGLMAGIGAAVLAAGYLMTRPSAPAQGSLLEQVAAPNAMLNPYLAWIGHGHHGPVPHRYAKRVMANCNAEAIQLAEGTVSVTALFEAPQYEAVPSHLGGRHG